MMHRSRAGCPSPAPHLWGAGGETASSVMPSIGPQRPGCISQILGKIAVHLGSTARPRSAAGNAACQTPYSAAWDRGAAQGHALLAVTGQALVQSRAQTMARLGGLPQAAQGASIVQLLGQLAGLLSQQLGGLNIEQGVNWARTPQMRHSVPEQRWPAQELWACSLQTSLRGSLLAPLPARQPGCCGSVSCVRQASRS